MSTGFIAHFKTSSQEVISIYNSDEKLVDIFVQRARKLNLNEIIAGNISSYNKTLGGYFVQTSKNQPIFIPSKEKYTIGQAVFVEVTKEARLGKEATGTFTLKEPYLPNLVEIAQKKYPFPIKTVYQISEDIEDALQSTIPFADGALLLIERTNALWTIDVDSSKSTLPLQEINKLAIPIIAEQIKLKNLSGMILIDFAGFKSQTQKKELLSSLKMQFRLDEKTKIYDFTKMNLLEIKRARTNASLFDLFYTPDNKKTPDYINLLIKEKLTQIKTGYPVLEIHPAQIPFLDEEIKKSVKIKNNLNIETDFFDLKEK